MARYSSSDSSGNIFAILVAGLAAALFAIIVMWPSGSNAPAGTAFVDTPLSEALNDPTTKTYLATLQRVKPNIARDLNRDAAVAIENGADQNELALLLFEAYSEPDPEDFTDLVYADVKHFDGMVRKMEQGLKTMSRKAPQFCTAKRFERYVGSSQETFMREMSDQFGYGSGVYDWALEFSQMTLEAIESGRKSPKKYDRLTSQDQMTLQTTLMGMMSNPNVAKLMRVSGGSGAAQQQAIMNMNFCDLGTDLLAVASGLPGGLKTRLLGELQHQTKDGNLESMMRAAQSSF
ncbi:MAG: hypothetical protein AAGL90_06020 [Pseudomonadota bacterium]